MSAAAIALPAGFWVNGVHHREAELRPLNGEDEAFLLDSGGTLPPARRTTALLARCLTRLGPWSPAPPAAARALSLGDREALLLHLRRLILGERLECVLRCSAPGCGEPMELDLAVSDLLAPLGAPASPWHEELFRAGGGAAAWQVRFRLPTGEDQELAADLVRTDTAGAAALLLGRCVAWAAPEGGEPAELPAAVAQAVADRMAELDPQAETTLRLDCPACGRGMVTLFDAAAWLFQEVAGRAADLYREVHLLAFYYHWREADILAMTGRKRRLYLGFLAEALGWEKES
ncbi:MAG TPA: hypothetical protein VHQ90_09480 [Thermoanaerobaculia bacterium]|nr:hypothetical protein [Thermoanaerobaculia bacterium]